MEGLEPCPVPMGERPDNCPGFDRRIADPWRQSISDRVEQMERRQDEMHEALTANTRLTAQIAANTAEIVEFFHQGKAFFQVASAIGTFAKWIAAIGAAVAVAWVLFKFGVAQAIREFTDQ